MEWLSRKSAKRCAVTQSAEEKQRGLVLVPALPSGKESRLLLKADSATQGPVSVPVVISESQSASYDVLSMGMILSAFEELKTGRKVEYCVTVAPGISPLRSDQRRAGSEDGLDSSGSQAGSQSGSNSNSYRMDSGEEGTGSGPRSRSRHSRSRDDRAAMELQLPITPEDIVRMPVEEFNNYVSGQVARLQPEQIQLMKDIRRRGKNKVAAQNCRRRKLDNMGHLEGEIMKLRLELSAASARRDQVARERDNYRHTLRNSISVIQTTGLGSMDSSLNLEPPQSSSVSSSSSSSTTTSIIQRNPAMKNKRYANDISHTADDPQKETLRKRKRE